MEKNNILYLIVGWLFGILGQIIIWWNVRSHNKSDIKLLIMSELKDAALRLTCTYGRVQSHLGAYNAESLSWLKKMYKKYGDESLNEASNFLEEKLKNVTNEEIQLASQLIKEGNHVGLSLKRCQLFSDGFILSNIALFNSRFQKDIIDIKFQVTVLNEEIENAMYFYKLTFDVSSMNTNSQVILGNIKDVYGKIMRICKSIVDKIDVLLEV